MGSDVGLICASWMKLLDWTCCAVARTSLVLSFACVQVLTLCSHRLKCISFYPAFCNLIDDISLADIRSRGRYAASPCLGGMCRGQITPAYSVG